MTRISKMNASKLALMIGYKSIEDEIKVAKQHYTDVSSLVKPIYEKYANEWLTLSPVMKLNDSGVCNIHLSEDTPVEQSNVFSERKYALHLLEDTLESVGLDRWRHRDNIKDMFRNMFDSVVDGDGIRQKVSLDIVDDNGHDLYVVEGVIVSTQYQNKKWARDINLPLDYHEDIKNGTLKKVEIARRKFNDDLAVRFQSLCRDLFTQIQRAGTVKNLLTQWPECSPFIDMLGMKGDAEIAKPLGNIILRHLKALPQAEA